MPIFGGGIRVKGVKKARWGYVLTLFVLVITIGICYLWMSDGSLDTALLFYSISFSLGMLAGEIIVHVAEKRLARFIYQQHNQTNPKGDILL